jgi:hypothetical protein
MDWHEWHDAYDSPDSYLGRRLALVQERIRLALDDAPPGPLTAISICAGQGRDLIGVLADRPRRHDVRARLVELDERNGAVRCRGDFPRPRRPYPSHPQGLRPFDPARGLRPGPPSALNGPRPQTPDRLKNANRC